MSLPFDRYGSCPECEENWDGGDILEELSKIDVFRMKPTAERQRIATAYYGHTSKELKKFSNLITIETKVGSCSVVLYKCPSCGSKFDIQTGEKIPDTIIVNTEEDAENESS